MSIKKFPIHNAVIPMFLAFTLSACSSSSSDSDPIIDATDADVTDPDNIDPDAILDDADAFAAFETCEAANGAEVASVEDAPIFAFASTAAPDFSAGQYERISLSNTPTLSGCTTPGLSDVFVVTDGTFAYGLGRSQQDSLTQFDATTLEANFQFSLIGDDAVTANPHDVVFLNETTAYVARYDTNLVFIIDPTAATEDNATTGFWIRPYPSQLCGRVRY